MQVYRTEAELLEPLVGFVADGIWRSDRIVIIATLPHRGALERSLGERGINFQAVVATKQLMMFDASEMLARFMVGDHPDRSRFMNTVGEVVSQAVVGGRKLRAFGEMVALLWEQDKRQAALELEALWNDLSRERSFSLFCAYPAQALDRANAGPSLADICRLHDNYIPALEEGRR